MPGSKAKTRTDVEHWRTPYLGLRDIPAALNDFELTTFEVQERYMTSQPTTPSDVD